MPGSGPCSPVRGQSYDSYGVVNDVRSRFGGDDGASLIRTSGLGPQHRGVITSTQGAFCAYTSGKSVINNRLFHKSTLNALGEAIVK